MELFTKKEVSEIAIRPVGLLELPIEITNKIMDYKDEDKIIWYNFIEKLVKDQCEGKDIMDINYNLIGVEIAKFFGYVK